MKLLIKPYLLVLTLLLCGGLYSQACYALSLGNVKIESFLNQPLSFTIPLKQSPAEHWQAEDMLLSLADSDSYHQQGLSYPWALGGIALQVQADPEGQLYIRGKSKKVVRELLVALLIKLEWPKGAIQKEYIALIDVNGVTNKAPKPAPEVVVPAQAIQVSVQQGSASESVVVEPYSGEVTPVEAESAAVEALPEPEPEPVLPAAPKVVAAYPSDEPVYVYKVARGDMLSLLAQRFRGDVKLPLHQYIHAISDENAEQYPKGLEDLTVGEHIRIPNPTLVVQGYEQARRQLQDDGGAQPEYHHYMVRYGDSLFLIAKAFKPEGTDTEKFIDVLRNENADRLQQGKKLRPGVRLRIPNPEYTAVAPEPEVGEQEPAIEPEPVEPPPELAEDELVPLTPLQEELSVEPENSMARRGIAPGLKANLRAIEQYVGRDEGSLVYEVIQANSRLPLLYEQVLRLNEQVSDLRLELASLKVENRQLQQQLGKLQENTAGASRSLQWLLLLLVVLLVTACIALYFYIRILAKRLDYKAALLPELESPPVAEAVEKPVQTQSVTKPTTKSATGLKERLLGKQEEDQPVVVGEQDYSEYDISKSNYDYSESYDLDALEESMKEGGSAFAQRPATIEIEAYSENLRTVKKFIKSQDFSAAGVVLDKLIAADSSQFENWLVRLELLLKTDKQDESNALYAQLQQMFAEPEQQRAMQSLMGAGEAVAVYPEPDADTLYEIRVYLSYSHFDMAEMSINKLLQSNPVHPDILLLQLEWLLGTRQQLEFDQLQQQLSAVEMTETQQSAFNKLCEEADFSAEDTATVFDDDTHMLPPEPVDETLMIDEGFDLGEMEELESDFEADVVTAETEDEKMFLAAIQEQMESYTAEDSGDADDTGIPDEIRIPD